MDFADYLGLPYMSVRRMVWRLTEGELELLERRTGVGAEQLRVMTLEAFDGSLVRITGQTRRLTAPANWRFYGTTSRYCPACLADNGGRWQVHWRLGWTFACTRHRVLLLERCPRCGKHPPVLSGGNHRMLSRPQACRSLTERDGRGTRCGYPLTEAPAVSLSPKAVRSCYRRPASTRTSSRSIAVLPRANGPANCHTWDDERYATSAPGPKSCHPSHATSSRPAAASFSPAPRRWRSTTRATLPSGPPWPPSRHRSRASAARGRVRVDVPRAGPRSG
ncbi:TniQ family protein [Streptomyces sp. H27-D2]|nr:TniQ family protein [Streptomyces sp. H27-D2]MEC4015482.1 TniQ family protein [Streptomyces sp. H27-D2]